jgi:hypothetical protein
VTQVWETKCLGKTPDYFDVETSLAVRTMTAAVVRTSDPCFLSRLDPLGAFGNRHSAL